MNVLLPIALVTGVYLITKGKKTSQSSSTTTAQTPAQVAETTQPSNENTGVNEMQKSTRTITFIKA